MPIVDTVGFVICVLKQYKYQFRFVRFPTGADIELGYLLVGCISDTEHHGEKGGY
jgi:hypothetical protein